MTAHEPQIRKGRKYEQVLEGAREVFMKEGYEGASVDDIARAGSVSKATLYNYFPDKRLLFLEVTRTECVAQAGVAMARIDTARPVALVLRDMAERMIEFYCSEFGLRIFRIFVAESARFPDIGRAFYRTGPEMARDFLVSYFETAMTRGELAIEDLPLAADQFHELCRADLFARALFNIEDEITPEARARVAQGAVETFLARYRA